MSKLTNAENHAMIASELYKLPLTEDFNYVTRVYVETDGTCRIDTDHPFDEPTLFDLLETEDGEPTQQAKASAMDVLRWLDAENFKTNQDTPVLYELFCCNPMIPQEAIYEAAKCMVETNASA